MKASTEYDEEYIKSLMARMARDEIDELIVKAESYHYWETLPSIQQEARQIIKLREDMDKRLADYRDQQ